MRTTTAFFLVLVIALRSFYNLGVLVYWTTNHAQIVATQCENRDRPERHCDGKCYLQKKLADAPDAPSDRSGNSGPDLKKGIEWAEIFPVALDFTSCAEPLRTAALLPVPPFFPGDAGKRGVFRPPSGGPGA